MSLLQSVLFLITTSTEKQVEDSIVLRKKDTQVYFLTYLNIFVSKFTQKMSLF